MQGRIVLAGGGNERDSRPIDEVFASWLAPHQKILYLPLALRGIRPLEECLNWIRATFLPLKITNISMWADFSGHQADELFEFSAIYIGGGNTYSLLAQCLESGFDRHLMEYTANSGISYGGSAGAALLGKDIRTVSHIDHNYIGLTATKGLNLANGHSVWVHYKPQDDELIIQHQNQHHQTVLAISEKAGVILDDSGLYSAGFESAYLFDERGKRPI